MPLVTITHRFNLRRDDGSERVYQPGTYDVPDEDLSHWYVRAHVENPPDLPDAPVSDAPEELGDLVTVTIVKPFALTRDSGERVLYDVGEHEMPRADADHWFTRFHSDDPPPHDYQVGTPEYGQRQLREQAAARLREQVIEQEAQQAALDVKDRRKGRGGRKVEAAEETTADSEPETPLLPAPETLA